MQKMERRILNSNLSSLIIPTGDGENIVVQQGLSPAYSLPEAVALDVMFFITHTYRILLNAVLEAVVYIRIEEGLPGRIV
jgi:hypothetical protein